MTEAHNGLFIAGKPLGEWKGEYDDYKDALEIILNRIESSGELKTPMLDDIGRIARSALTGGQ